MKYIKSYKHFESKSNVENLYIHIDGSHFPSHPERVYTSAYMTTDSNDDDYFLSGNFDKNYVESVFNIRLNNLTSAHAEMLSLYQILNILKEVKNKNIIIYSDYMTNYTLTMITKAKYKKADMKVISKIIRAIYNQVIQKNDVSVRWIKGHAQVYGNVIANNLAKNRNIFDTISPYLLEIPENRTSKIKLQIPEYSINKII